MSDSRVRVPQIIVQGGTQGMRAWVRNIAAMALAADPHRTHQSVKVMGSETATIRYLGQGRCVIRITGDEVRRGIAFQLLHDQLLQPQWYTVVYDAEDKAFKVRKTAPPQYDSTWYGTRETDEGTVVERKVHWYSRPSKPSRRARLLGASGPKSLADDERILAAAPGSDGKANLLICRGEVGQASQVLARWWATSSSSWQDTPIMDVPAYSVFGGEPQALILSSGFSPDGMKVVVAAQRAGCWDLSFRDGAEPRLQRLYDADVLPADLLGFVGGQSLEFQTRADIGAPEYFGHWPGFGEGVGYQGEACWNAEPPSGKEAFTDYAVKRRAVRRRLEIDTLDLQRTDEQPDALMWVKRETDTEDHLHELAQPAVKLREGSLPGDCDMGDGPFKQAKVYAPSGYLVMGQVNAGREPPQGIGDRRAYELFGVQGMGYAKVGEAPAMSFWAPEGLRVSWTQNNPWIYTEPPEFLEYRGQRISRTGFQSGVRVQYSGTFQEDSVEIPVLAEYEFLHSPGRNFYYLYRDYTFWEYTVEPPAAGETRPKVRLLSEFTYPGLGALSIVPLGGGIPDPDDPARPAPQFTDELLSFVEYPGGIFLEAYGQTTLLERLCILDSDNLGLVVQKQPPEREPSPGYRVSGYTSFPDLPWAQLAQACSVSTAHFEVKAKVAELVKQQTMTTTASIVASGSDPYTSAIRTIERTFVRGAATSAESRAMLTTPVVASLSADARVVDNMTGTPVGEAFNGFNSPGLSDFSMEHAGDQDLVFPGLWASPLLSTKHQNYYLQFPMQDTLLLREIWAFGQKVGEIRIGERPAGSATALLRYAAVNASVVHIPVGTGRDQNGNAARIADYGLQHVGYTFGHGGGLGWSSGYSGAYYGSASAIVLGYGGALGARSADFVATNPFNAHAPPWDRVVASADLLDDARMLSWTHNYGGSAVWERYDGRVCEVAYSPEARITVLTARGTAHVAHKLDDGTVVHANLLQLLGKANAQGYSRDWWVVNLVEL